MIFERRLRGPRIVPFQYRMSSLSSVVVCLCQREDDEDKENSTRQNSHAERTKITNAGSRVYDRSRVPTDWLKVNGEKRRRRRRRRRRRNKRKESDERRDVENRLNVALTSIGEPERAVVRVHSVPFSRLQLFQSLNVLGTTTFSPPPPCCCCCCCCDDERPPPPNMMTPTLSLLLLLRRRGKSSSEVAKATSKRWTRSENIKYYVYRFSCEAKGV